MAKIKNKARQKTMFGKKNKPPKKAVKSNDFVLITIKTHKDSKGGHPHGIIDNVEDKHVSVGFTDRKSVV